MEGAVVVFGVLHFGFGLKQIFANDIMLASKVLKMNLTNELCYSSLIPNYHSQDKLFLISNTYCTTHVIGLRHILTINHEQDGDRGVHLHQQQGPRRGPF